MNAVRASRSERLARRWRLLPIFGLVFGKQLLLRGGQIEGIRVFVLVDYVGGLTREDEL